MRLSLLAAALAALSFAPAADAAPAARRVHVARRERIPLSRLLARTFKMYGGVDALLRVGGLRVAGTIDDGAAAPGARPRIERLLQPPERFRSTISLGGLERESLVLDGGRAFRDGLEVTGLLRADQIRLEAARAFLPAALARERGALLDRGEALREGRTVRLVELRLHRKASLVVELDASTGRILRATTIIRGRESAVVYAELRPIAGVLFAFEEEHRSREGRHRVVFTEVEVLPAYAVHIERP